MATCYLYQTGGPRATPSSPEFKATLTPRPYSGSRPNREGASFNKSDAPLRIPSFGSETRHPKPSMHPLSQPPQCGWGLASWPFPLGSFDHCQDTCPDRSWQVPPGGHNLFQIRRQDGSGLSLRVRGVRWILRCPTWKSLLFGRKCGLFEFLIAHFPPVVTPSLVAALPL